MTFPVDLSLFEKKAHNPSFLSLQESMGSIELKLRDYCIPVNAYFPPHEAITKIKGKFETIIKYYPEHSYETGKVISELQGVPEEKLVLANGSTELISWIDHLFVKDSLITPIPTFGRWTDQPEETGKKLFTIERKEEKNFELSVEEIVDACKETGAGSFVLSNPNNPTGAMMKLDDVIEVVYSLSELDVVIIDESFIDFSSQNIPTMTPLVDQFENLIVLKSLGKNFGLHGVRMGYAVSNEIMAKKLKTMLPRWNINGLAESVIKELPLHWHAYDASRLRTIRDRDYLFKRLQEIDGVKVFPSYANFVFIKLPEWVCGRYLRNDLANRYGLIIRECGNKIGSSTGFCRIASRPAEDVDILIDAIKELFLEYSESKSNLEGKS